MTGWLQRFSAWLASHLIRRRVLWFVLGLGVAALALPMSARLKYNRSMEGFFPADDPRLQLYQRSKNWFGGEATLIVVYTDPQLWTPAGMQRQLRLSRALRSLGELGVRSVLSLADRPAPRQPLQTIAEAVEKQPERAGDIREQVLRTNLYRGVFVAADGRTTALVVQLQPRFADSDESSRCLVAVRDTAEQSLRAEVERGALPRLPVVAGTMLMIHDVYDYSERDGRVVEAVSILLMGLVIALSFRSVRWVVLPILIVYSGLFWSRGVWAIVNGELTMVSSAISSLAAVIGVSTVVHFGLRYHELRPLLDTASALRQTFAELGPPVFWILATTAGGFAALLVCELKPVTDFAWIMVLVSLLIGVAIMSYLPLGVMGIRDAGPRSEARAEIMGPALVRSLEWIQRRPWLTALALIVPFTLLGLGVLRLRPQTDFTNNFRKSTGIYQAYDFIEREFGGAGQLELVFDCPDLLSLPDKELQSYLDRLRALEKKLAELPAVRLHDGQEAAGVTKVLGLADFIDFFDSMLGPGLFTRVRLLLVNGQIDEARKELGPLARLVPESVFKTIQDQPIIAPNFWNRAEGKMRLVLQARERLATEDKAKLIVQAEETATQLLGADANAKATGIYVMLAHLIESLLADQNRTFALSLLCQFGMGVLAFGSFWLAVITMVPTVLPVVAVVGTMGWLGFPVNIATAMLASVAMGMTIDSSILYIYRFKQERREGADFQTALMRTQGTAGIAVVISNLALVLGFGVLVLSRFIPLVHFGIFTSLALLGGMAGNLVLLPLLLHLAPGIKGPGGTPASVGATPAPGPAKDSPGPQSGPETAR